MTGLVDWAKLNAMRQQAINEGWPPITIEELTNLCRLTGVVFAKSGMYYQIRRAGANSYLLEVSKRRSVREFIEAFKDKELL